MLFEVQSWKNLAMCTQAVLVTVIKSSRNVLERSMVTIISYF